MVIGVYGANHKDTVRWTESAFQWNPELSQNNSIVRPDSKYVGGEARVENESEEKHDHVILAWEGPSHFSDDIYMAHILQTLLGGGTSFSAGGPGKVLIYGLHTAK
jgi:processing peptidase subunit alpha